VLARPALSRSAAIPLHVHSSAASAGEPVH
jgi:hypothetical protein